jgi:hypothetical protein
LKKTGKIIEFNSIKILNVINVGTKGVLFCQSSGCCFLWVTTKPMSSMPAARIAMDGEVCWFAAQRKIEISIGQCFSGLGVGMFLGRV